MFAPMSLLRD